MVAPLLVVNNVRKVYSDGTEAVKGVSFSVRPGEVFGLVGPNGAGKSTTMKIIATLLRPTSGDILVAGVDAVRRPLEARRFVAYLPESVSPERGLRVREFLAYLAELYSAGTGRDPGGMVERALNVSGLWDAADRKLGALSKGMFRRLMIGAVFMLDAPVVVLDEPTSGVDVIERVRIREIIRGAARGGKVVVFSSHDLSEVEALCDRVAFMFNGRVLVEGSVDEVRGDYRNLEEAFVSAVMASGGVVGRG